MDFGDDEPVYQPHKPSTGSSQRGSAPAFPVTEDHEERTWEPRDKCPDYAMNLVLEILLERGRQYQQEIAEELAARADMKLGTARGYVSGALLYFRESGWVRCVEQGGGPHSPVWELTE